MKSQPIMSVAAFHAEIAKQQKAAKDAAASFVAALQSGSPALLAEALERLEYNPDGWSRALRDAAKLTNVPSKSRSMMLHLWLHDGDAIRDGVNSDLLLCDALRNVLPTYRGGAVTIFRGESARNRQRRTYGLSWSSDCRIANAFARGPGRRYVDGSVVLETLAPSEAIICVPLLHTPLHKAEKEYLVDRRRLGAVKVVRRYSAAEPGISF